jgi:hypothetical protein
MLVFILTIVLVFFIIYIFSGLGKLTYTRAATRSGMTIADGATFESINETFFGIKPQTEEFKLLEGEKEQEEILSAMEQRKELKEKEIVIKRTNRFLKKYTFEKFLRIRPKLLLPIMLFTIGLNDLILVG